MAADPALLAGCQQFEAVMLRPLLEQLNFGRDTSLANDVDDSEETSSSESGAAADLMHSMFVDVFALALARAGGVGLASELAAALSTPRR
jgi:Rod binding domain-containing protein